MIKRSCLKFNACSQAAHEQKAELVCDKCHHYIPIPGSQEAKNRKEGTKMNNKLADLNDKLFDQLERLNNGDLSDDGLSREVSRSHAICSISSQIISNAALALKAHTTLNTGMTKKAPKMLEG